MATEALSFYSHQSLMTDPGTYAHLFDELPCDIYEIHDVIQGLLIHFSDVDFSSQGLKPQRLKDLECRYLETMLASLIRLENRPLLLSRSPQHKLIASCRDFALFFCAILRHHGIPSRCRVAFNAYFYDDIFHDQVVVEYWNEHRGAWCLVDPRLSLHQAELRDIAIDFDLCDVPRDQLILAPDAWMRVREGQECPQRFCGHRGELYRGLWYLRDRLVQDFAAINSVEMQLWDCWGMLLETKDIEENFEALRFLDDLARLSREVSRNFSVIRRSYLQSSRLCVGSRIQVRGPYVPHRILKIYPF